MTRRVESIMRREILTFDAETPIRQAAGLLHASGQEAAPVVDASGSLIGVLTPKDCFRPALQASYYRQWQGTVGDQMSSPVTTIDAQIDLVAAAQMFLSAPHRALPVIDGGRLTGLLNRIDLLRALLEMG